jgi:serine/threonine protein kinase
MPTEPYFLPPGTELNNRYTIGAVIGHGGFGITYKAWDKALSTVVVIKEYYYTGVASRQADSQAVQVYDQNRKNEFYHFLKRFIDEARYVAKFGITDSIVNVFDYFEANNTAYMVMEFLAGVTLSERLKQKKAMSINECLGVMKFLFAALKTVHAANIIHRDISPDNIFLCTNGKVKLIDFGAARFSKKEDQQMSRLTQVVKPGYSPPEQYLSISAQGPWTDIYALGASLYYMVTGNKPVESTNRVKEDNITHPNALRHGLPDHINDTILRAMAIDAHLRFSSVDEFEKALTKEKKVLDVASERKRRRKNRFIGITASVVIVAIALVFFAYIYNQQRLAVTLPDATIEWWYALPRDVAARDAKTDSYESIIEVFNASYPNVTIELVAFEYDEYVAAITDAYDDDSLPHIFESSGIDDEILESAHSVADAVRSLDYSELLFFDEYFAVFPEANFFPLGFNAPAVYTNAFLQDGGVTQGNNRDFFLAGRAREYTGSTADFLAIQAALPGRYVISSVDGKNPCDFAYSMSIGSCSADQLLVVNRLLAFLLSENAQDYIHIRYQSGSLPLNRETLLEDFVAIYDDFAGFFDDLERFDITGKETNR